MESKIMSNIVERLKHYQTKCCQNLNRVRLSHILALTALQNEQVLSEEKYKDLVSASFADMERDKNLLRMHLVLHSQHLLSLKINFELFLNRLLSTIWAFHFTELAQKISGDVSLSELASSRSPSHREHRAGEFG
jgi:CHAD domain-containing protein